MRACSVLAANHAIEARADCRQDRIWLGKQTAPLAQTPVRCRCAGSSRALLRFRTGVVPKASTSPPMGWSGRTPASTARKAGKGATTTRSTLVPQAHYGIAVLAGLRRQAAIAKCKAWTDPIHTK